MYMHELSCLAPLPLCNQHVTSWTSQGYSLGGSSFNPWGRWSVASLVSLVGGRPQVKGMYALLGLWRLCLGMSVPRVPSFRLGWECAHPDHLLLAPHAVGLRRWPFALLPSGQDRGYPQDCWPFGLFYLGYYVYLCCFSLRAWIGGVVAASSLTNWYKL